MLKLTAPAVALATLASALTSAPALATDFMTTRDYYSDATFTVQVGGTGNSCNRIQWAWGEVTEYEIVSREPCAGTWPPPGWNP